MIIHTGCAFKSFQILFVTPLHKLTILIDEFGECTKKNAVNEEDDDEEEEEEGVIMTNQQANHFFFLLSKCTIEKSYPCLRMINSKRRCDSRIAWPALF